MEIMSIPLSRSLSCTVLRAATCKPRTPLDAHYVARRTAVPRTFYGVTDVVQRRFATASNISPYSTLKSVQNFRDVSTSSPSTLKRGKLFRSARLDHASPTDWKALLQHYGIKSTIDLRSDEEQRTTPPPEGSVLHHHINITGTAYSRAVITHLSLWDQAQLLIRAATGQRDEAVRILGSKAIMPRGLVGLAKDTLDASGSEIRQVFSILSKDENYPICIFCHSGKDRTGLITALVLLLCQVDVAAVQADYSQSVGQKGLPESGRAERVHELQQLGLPADFADVDPCLVDGIVKHCNDTYGSVDGYLSHIGVDEATKRRVRDILLES